MNRRAAIALATVATLLTLVGLLPVVRTLANLTTFDQLRHLLGYDYMSFADSLADRDFGDAANDFYIGVALMLVGGTLFIPIERTRPIARIVVAALFALLAFSLVYACMHPRIGIRPF
ncbi:hypothetical protein [Burkholderia pseudomultivorans]|uniref:hypothetical protein n=1 Tax=Burkholderia pseudomultivorans TaxID=1207504 RepID=UPI0007564029|nr:hypothetical protein [Burkholderia pseudomultivorans]KWF02632.1 hypothetical protein WT55_28615 [Burkholderia pseudomultivorans]KWI61147.1 hypothetical protein WT72_06030 [Burkholderia pseudomultivorans]